MPNLNLVNQPSLDKILKAEVFVHIDDQLRAAYLILDYVPISKSFLVLKCVIKARDPRLQWINVVAPRFLLFGPVPEGMFTTEPIPKGIPRVALPPQQTTLAATSSPPTNIEEEEKVVELFDSKDEFEVFNQALSPETSILDLDDPSFNLGHPFTPILEEMGIQCKQKTSLLDLIESQPRKVCLGRPLRLSLPHPPPPTCPAPQA